MAKIVSKMALVRREPVQELVSWVVPWEEEIDGLLGFGSGWLDWPHSLWHHYHPLTVGLEYLPPMEVLDRDGQTVVRLEVPGIKLEDIDISLADGELTIKGEKKLEEEVKEEDCYCSERSYGAFRRVLSVPQGLDESKISATYQNGVLEVLLPKVEESKPHTIKVEIK